MNDPRARTFNQLRRFNKACQASDRFWMLFFPKNFEELDSGKIYVNFYQTILFWTITNVESKYMVIS